MKRGLIFLILILGFIMPLNLFAQDKADKGVDFFDNPEKVEEWLNEPGLTDQERKNREFLHEVYQKRKIIDQKKLNESNIHYNAGVEQFEVGRFLEAESSFTKALEVYPQNNAAKKMLDATQKLLGRQEDDPNRILKDKVNKERIGIQASVMKLRSLYEEAEKKYKEGVYNKDLHRSIKSLNACLKILDDIKWRIEIIPPVDTSEQYARVLNTIKANIDQFVDKTKDILTIQQKRFNEEVREKGIDTHKELTDAEMKMAREYIMKLFKNAIMLAESGDYQAAIDVMDEIIKKDPNNQYAKELKRKYFNGLIQFRENKYREDLEEEFEKVIMAIKESTVPRGGGGRPVVYPEYWDIINSRRITKEVKEIEKPKWMQEIEAKMEQPITFEFDGTPITEVVKLLNQKTGTNILIEPKTFEDFGGVVPPVTLKVENMKFSIALKWILRLSNLNYDLRDQVIYIAPEKYLVGEPEQMIYDIRDLVVPIISFPAPAIEFGTDDGGGMGGLESEEIVPEDTPSPESIEAILRSIDSETGWGEGTDVQIDQGRLIITQRKYMHEKIAKTLEMLRKSAKLVVVVEAKYIEIDDDYLESVGVEWQDVVYGGTLGRYGSDNLDRWSRYRFTGGLNDNIIGAVSEQVGGIAMGAGEGFSLVYQLLGNAQANFILNAVQKSKKGSLLFAPKITVYNTQRAHLMVVQTESYVSDYTVTGGNVNTNNNNNNGTQNAADPEIENFTTGVVLDVKPIVSSDRRYITLELRPTTSTLGPAGIKSIEVGQNPGTNGGPGTPITVQSPQLQFRRVRTTVTVPDGGTILIGGLSNSIDYTYKQGIPLLSKLPFIGRLFGSEGRRQEKRQLLIFVTAKIVIYDEIERMGHLGW